MFYTGKNWHKKNNAYSMKKPEPLRIKFFLVIKGLFMGAANKVPAFSGGIVVW